MQVYVCGKILVIRQISVLNWTCTELENWNWAWQKKTLSYLWLILQNIFNIRIFLNKMSPLIFRSYWRSTWKNIIKGLLMNIYTENVQIKWFIFMAAAGSAEVVIMLKNFGRRAGSQGLRHFYKGPSWVMHHTSCIFLILDQISDRLRTTCLPKARNSHHMSV